MMYKNYLNMGFTIVELMLAVIISVILAGGLGYVVGEGNFYLKRQMYIENVNQYADFVMNDIFSSVINANFVNIESSNQIVCGYKTNDDLDSLKIYEHSINEGVLINGDPLKYAVFHNKNKNKNYYMQVTNFRSKHTLDGQGYNADVRDALIDIFLGIKLHYNRGNKKITEEFPFKKTIFTRYAAVYNASKEFDD